MITIQNSQQSVDRIDRQRVITYTELNYCIVGLNEQTGYDNYLHRAIEIG